MRSARSKVPPGVMNEDVLRELVRQDGERMQYYMTPELNSVLYLHFKGFKAIGGLREYTGLRCLWLEGNAISRIEGLDTQAELRCLYLQDNMVSDLSGLAVPALAKLDTLNLANNRIARIAPETFSQTLALSSLNLSRNSLAGPAGECLEGLLQCRNLAMLDISTNAVTDGAALLAMLQQLPELKLLNLAGNPAAGEIPEYRRTMICALQGLTYLDELPVFPKERRLAEAWMRGGEQAEQEERAALRKEEEDRDRRSFELLDKLMQDAAAVPEEMPLSPTAPVVGQNEVALYDVAEDGTETLAGTFAESTLTAIPPLDEVD